MYRRRGLTSTGKNKRPFAAIRGSLHMQAYRGSDDQNNLDPTFVAERASQPYPLEGCDCYTALGAGKQTYNCNTLSQLSLHPPRAAIRASIPQISRAKLNGKLSCSTTLWCSKAALSAPLAPKSQKKFPFIAIDSAPVGTRVVRRSSSQPEGLLCDTGSPWRRRCGRCRGRQDTP